MGLIDLDLLAKYGPGIAKGLVVTIELVAISVPLGFLIAVALAYFRLEGGAVTRGAIGAFTGFFRGTPVIAQLFLVYFGAGQFNAALKAVDLWWLLRDAFGCAVLVFTLNTAAYQAEILRGAISAVPRGQIEAGEALGMERLSIWRLILGPQALLLALRPLGNELILMIKASSLASVITVLDLMGATKKAYALSLSFEVYLYAAIAYLVMVEIVRRAWNAMERRMTRRVATA